MKFAYLVCCILVIASVGLSCAPESILEISVVEIDNGVVIENAGTTDCIVFINSLEGEQQFELAIGDSITVTDISQAIEVSAVIS